MALTKDQVLAAAGPELDHMQDETRAAVRSLKRLAAFPPILFFGAAIGFFTPLGGWASFAIFISLSIVVIVVGIRAMSRIFRARSRVMEAVAPAMGLDFSARAQEPIDLSAFKNTYFGSTVTKTRVEDVLSGARGNTAFQIFDAVVTGRSKGPDGEWRYGQPPSWLEGVSFSRTRIVRVELPGRWTARTVVVRDYGHANRLQKPSGMDRVALVDSQFDDVFEVFSTDQVEARAVLTPAVMERLMSLEDIFTQEDNPAVAVFEGGAFMVAMRPGALARAKEQFDLESAEAINASVVEFIIAELNAVTDIVDALAGPSAEEPVYG